MKFLISKFNLGRQFTKEEREVFVNCVKNASEIEVILNDHSKYTAKIVGSDPATLQRATAALCRCPDGAALWPSLV